MTFVEGEAGVGKTSLLRHAREMLSHGYLCRGRFTPPGPVEPLSGWASALRDLANALLAGDSMLNDEWRKEMLHALGEGAALICVLVPEWAAILAPPQQAEQPLAGGLNRIAIAIHSLFRCLAEPDTPVVVMLDDLQWADESSLRILELVLELPGNLNLSVLAAIRTAPDRAGASAALQAFRDRLATGAVEVESVRLGNWGPEEIRDFLSDSFGETLSHADVFADFVLARTHGNPFYVREFILRLVAQQLLRFEPGSARWSFRAEALRQLPPADGVVDFLARKLSSMTPELKHMLRTAACLGASFRSAELALATGSSLQLASAQLELAVFEGILLAREPESNGHATRSREHDDYEFAHDRVLEACRALISEQERAELCLRIGRALLSKRQAGAAGESAHKLAAYFNNARALISSDLERCAGAELDLEAGTLANQSAAFSQALEHFRAGIAFLSPLVGPESTPRQPEDRTGDHRTLTLVSIYFGKLGSRARHAGAGAEGRRELSGAREAALWSELAIRDRLRAERTRSVDSRPADPTARGELYPARDLAEADAGERLGTRYAQRRPVSHRRAGRR